MKIFIFSFFFLLSSLLFLQNTSAQCSGPAADAGTGTGINGEVPADGPFVYCIGDMLEFIVADSILPDVPIGNNPAVGWLFYNNEPTGPDADAEVPSFLNVAWTGPDFTDTHNNALLNFLIASGGSNHFWIAPGTLDDVSAAGFTIDVDGDGCFDVSWDDSAFEIYLLNEIEFAATYDGCAGTCTITITGGMPEFAADLGGSYTVTNTGVGTLTQSAGIGATVTITGLSNGDVCSFSVTDDGNGCTANFNATPIIMTTVDPSFTFVDFCEGDVNGPTGIATAGGTFSFNPAPGDGATINPATGVISGETAPNSYTVEYTVGVCNDNSTVTVNVLDLPAAPGINPNPITFCPGDNITISPTGAGTNFNFYSDIPPAGLIITAQLFDPTAFLTGPTTTFWVTETVGSCEGPFTTVDVTEITVNPPTLNPNAQTVCEGTTVTITPTDNNGEANPVFNFYGDAALTNLLSTGTDYTFSSNVDVQIWVTEIIGTCESTAEVFTLTIDPTPAQLVVGNEVICLNDPVPNISVAGNGGAITWYDINPSAGGVSPIFTGNSFPPPVNTSLIDIVSFWVTEINATGCESVPALFTITVEDLPAAPTAVSPAAICVGGVVPDLTANGTGGTLNWYNVDPTAGSPPVVGSGSPFSTGISSAVAGTFDFWVTETNNNNCESLPTQVTITVEALSAAPTAVSPAAICIGDVVPDLTANGTGGTLNWYNVDPTAGNPPVIGSGSPFSTGTSSVVAGTFDFWVTETNGGCESLPASVTITVNTAPAAPASNSPVQVCVDDPAPSLNAGSGGTITWYFTDPALGNPTLAGTGSPFVAPVSTSTVGSVSLWVTEEGATGCESLATQVDINIEPLPTLIDVQLVCSADLQTYTATVSLAGTDGLTTSEGSVVDNGGGSFTISNINADNDLTVTANNSLTSCSDGFIINAPDCSCPTVDLPVSDGNVLICTGDVIPELSVTVGVGETANWYDVPLGGAILPGGQATITYTPLVAGTYFVETEIVINGCLSLARTVVILTVNPLPTLISSQVDCAADLLSYTVVFDFLNADELTVSEGDVISSGGGVYTVSNIDISNAITVTASNSSTNCFDDFIIQAPNCACPDIDPPISDGDVEICEGDDLPILSVTVGVGETVNWYDVPVGGAILAGGQSTTTYTPTEAGSYFAETVVVSSDCVSATRTIVIFTINPLPTIINSEVTCSADLLTYTVTVNFADVTGVTISEGGLIDNGGGSFTITDVDINNDLEITATNSLTTCTDDFTITPPDCNCPDVDAPISDGNVEICAGDFELPLSVTVGVGETVNWYDVATGGTILVGGVNTTIFTPPAPGTYYAETVVITSGCVSIRTPVICIENPLPILVDFQANCSADLLTYTVTVNFTDATGLTISEGGLIDNGGGSFTITGVDINNDLEITATNSLTTCTDDFTIPPPDCDCPDVDEPVSDGNVEICTGDFEPPLSVTVGVGETVNWYDVATGGIILAGGENTTTFIPPSPGTYYAETVVIASGCVSAIRTPVICIENPLPMLVTSQADCSVDLLTYTVTVNFTDATGLTISEGGLIDSGGGNFTITGIDINNDLTLTAINSVTGCTDVFTIPPPNCNCPDVDAPVSDGNVEICEGDALLPLSVTVGVGETVNWYDVPVGGIILAGGENTTSFTPPSAGIYYAETVVITSGCVSSIRTPVVCIVNPLPTLNSSLSDCSADLLTYTVTLDFSDTDGLTISEGILIDNGDGNFIVSGIDINNDLTITASNSVTDCMDDFTIPPPDCPCPAVGAPVNDGDVVICEGDDVSALSVTVGVGETVDWYDMAVGGTLLADGQGTTTFTPSLAGIYFAETRLVINGCTSLIRTPVEFIINENPILSVVETIDPECGLANGLVTLNATNGALPYSYQINNNLPQDSPEFISLAANTYTFLVTDANDCSATPIDTTLVAPNEPIAVITGLDTLTCGFTSFAVDAAASIVDGGVTFEWLFEGVVVSDFIQINVDNPGVYILNVTQGGCVGSDTIVVEEILDTDLLAIIQNETQLDCNIASVTLDGSASTSGTSISYLWFFNDIPIPGANSNTYLAGEAGSYMISVYDNATGCSALFTYVLISNEGYPVANAGLDKEINCIIDDVLLDGSGSQEGESIVYQWSMDDVPILGATTQEWTVSLPATYQLEVRDTSNGCANIDIMLVVENTTLPTAEAGEDVDLGCDEESLSIHAGGSTAGAQISYQWTTDNSGEILDGENNMLALIGSVGRYWLTVTNGENGCSAIDSLYVGQADGIQTAISVVSQDVGCFGEENGVIILQPEDASATIMYSLNTAAFVANQSFGNLAAGNYSITAEDINGCLWDTTVVILGGVEMQVDLGEDVYLFLGDSLQLDALVNVPEESVASIKWTNPNFLHCEVCLDPYTTPLLVTSTFEVIVSDVNGCSASDAVTIYVNKERNVFIPNAFSPNGDGNNDLFVINSGNDVFEVKRFAVFDRWGEVLFNKVDFPTNSPTFGWDGNYRGRALNAGVYVYLAEIKFLDGKTEIFSGEVILMR